MMKKTACLDVVAKSLNWFEKSSVMEPENGFWGVAERVYLCPDKELSKKVFESFNSFTDYGDWSVVESRRADCNFQAAWLFLLAAEATGSDDARKIAENLLDYLYCRSGLLNRGSSDGAREGSAGVWNWSHTCWRPRLWFDDNSWTLAIPLMIAERYPDLAERYDMKAWADKLAREITPAFRRTFHASLGKPDADMSDPEEIWNGRPLLPHWGGLVCFALSRAIRSGVGDGDDMRQMIREYHDYLDKDADDRLNVSELAYAVICCTAAYQIGKEERYLALAKRFADRIIAKADPVTGNIPAEHYEAPSGPHLVDTIYTVNWCLLGIQNLVKAGGAAEYETLYEKLLTLFADIQDRDGARQFNGCWRGMFDMNTGSWGGGDRYEGGAGSIYSGWTNAPIAIAFANEALGISLVD